MNTAEALEKLTDRGKFEVLAARVLRKAERTYVGIIELGTNAAGETIVSPIDGFCKVPNSEPPHFVLIEHTTEDRKRLRSKWLDPQKGDLIKACSEAKQFRETMAKAKFTIVLSTNQRMPSENNSSLLRDVHNYAGRHKVELDIWELSRYADFLDTNGDGQWLRKEHLGISAEILSKDLLKQICNTSLALYKKNQYSKPENWIERELGEQLFANQFVFFDSSEKSRTETEENQNSLVFLVGDSGFGKSAFAYQFLRKQLSEQRLGLFIPDEVIETSISIEDALEQCFQKYYPGLLHRESRKIKELIPLWSKFLIIVDDINRAKDPTKLVRKLTSWAVPPYLIICPLWSRTWNLISKMRQGDQWTDVIHLKQMSLDESSKVLKTALQDASLSLTNLEIDELAIKLGLDPFLLGSFCKLLLTAKDEDVFALAENVISNYIESSIAEVAAKSNYHSFEYKEIFACLCDKMLHLRKLTPTWSEIKAWFIGAPEKIKMLSDLSKHGGICRISNNQKFVFRHDRLLEYFLIESVGTLLRQADSKSDVFWDPYYAELIGQALASVPCNLSLVSEIAEKSPLATAIAIKRSSTLRSEYHQSIATIFKNRVHSRNRYRWMPELVANSILRVLVNTDSPVVLEIDVNSLSGGYYSHLIYQARFRNGDTSSGVHLCEIWGINIDEQGGFSPLFEHVKKYHQSRIVSELKQILQFPRNDKELKGALILSGYLGLAEFDDVIIKCWNQLDEKRYFLAEFLWAIIKSFAEKNLSLGLQSILETWATESDKKQVSEKLLNVVREGISKIAIGYLIDQANIFVELKTPIAILCSAIDSPTAIEFAIHTIATNDENADSESGPLTESQKMIARWDYREHKDGTSFGKKLSPLSIEKLKIIWEDANNRDSVRNLAFSIWLNSVRDYKENILDTLRVISPKSPFFKQAVWTRCFLKDASVITDLIPLLNSDYYFLRIAGLVWTENLISTVQSIISVLCRNDSNEYYSVIPDEHYHLANFLTTIPTDKAEKILGDNWQCLKFSPIFIQTALYVGTTLCKHLANEATREYPEGFDIFKHVGYRFCFGFLSFYRPLTLEHLVNLEPFIDKFGESELRQLAKDCRQFGDKGVNWGRKHLYPLLGEDDRRRYYPSEQDLFDTLNSMNQNYISIWLDRFKEGHDPRNPLEIVKRWFVDNPSFERLKITAVVIQLIGSRADLAILNTYNTQNRRSYEQLLVEQILDETKFIVCRRSLI